MREEDIYKYLLGDVVIGNMYNSPIPGRNDDTPSFKLYERDGHIKWKDFGLPEQCGNSPENLFQHLRNLPLGGSGYYKAKVIIEKEVKFGMAGKPLTQLRRRELSDSTPYIQNGSFLDFELEYWKRFGYTELELISEDIYPVRKMSWEGPNGLPSLESKPTDPTFIYWWNKNPASYKTYRPFMPKRDKFRQYNIEGVIEGWDGAINTRKMGMSQPDLKVLFITSSTKDRLVIKKAFPPIDYTAINPRSEGDKADIIKQKDYLKSIAKRVIVLYDADNSGYVGSQIMAKEGGFETFDMRGKLDGNKDFSDYIDTQRGKHSYEDLVKLIKNIIQ